MNDSDRQLIQDVLRAAGSAGEQGFAYLVNYTIADGMTSILGFGLSLAGAIWCLRRAFAWKPNQEDDVLRLMIIPVLCLIIFLMLIGFVDGVTKVLAPQGAAIHSILH